MDAIFDLLQKNIVKKEEQTSQSKNYLLKISCSTLVFTKNEFQIFTGFFNQSDALTKNKDM